MAGNPIERLEKGLDSFTKSEEAAARYFIDHPASVLNKTIAAISKETGLTTTAIMRMCQRVGYTGYAEFRFSMNRYLTSHGPAEDRGSTPAAAQLAGAYASYFQKVAEGIDDEQLGCIAKLILDARRISIWGCNRTYESVMQLSLRLMRIGIFNQTTSDPQLMDDIASILETGDLCIVISPNGRGTKSYPSLMRSLMDRGCNVVLITMNPKIGLAKCAGETVVLPWISNDYEGGILEDQIIVFLFIECLLHKLTDLMDEAEQAGSPSC